VVEVQVEIVHKTETLKKMVTLELQILVAAVDQVLIQKMVVMAVAV
jgi:hypothetical protein